MKLTANAYRRIRATTGMGEGVYTIHVTLNAPIRGMGAVALFQAPTGHVWPIEPLRSARLTKPVIAADAMVSIEAGATDGTAGFDALRSLLGDLADKFELEPDPLFARGSPVLALDEDRLRGLARLVYPR